MLSILHQILDVVAIYPALSFNIRMFAPRLWSRMFVMQLIWRYLKWAVPPDLFLLAVNDHYLPGRIWWFFCAAGWTWICITDDDEWWKRQARKAAGVVRDLGHRLMVVVAPGPAGVPA